MKNNNNKHEVLNIEVSNESAGYVLYDNFNAHGFQNVGPSYYDLRDSGVNGKEILDNLPNDIYNKYGENFSLIPENNIKALVENHIVDYVDDSTHYDEIYNSLKKSNKDKYIDENGGVFNEPDIKSEIKKELISFISNEMKKHINISINNVPVYVWGFNSVKNWGIAYLNNQ